MPPVGIDQCNCFTMRKATRRITRFYDACLQPTGLRITQFLLLAALKEQEATAVNTLAERLDVERTAMGKMVGFLEKDGFVSIRPSPADGRSRVVALTAEGTKLYDRAVPLWREAQRRFSELNGAADVGTLRRSLAAMKVGELAEDSGD